MENHNSNGDHLAKPPSVQVLNKRGTILITVDSVWALVSTIVISIRIYTRFRISRFYGADDALILMAWVRQIALSSPSDVNELLMPGCHSDIFHDSVRIVDCL